MNSPFSLLNGLYQFVECREDIVDSIVIAAADRDTSDVSPALYVRLFLVDREPADFGRNQYPGIRIAADCDRRFFIPAFSPYSVSTANGIQNVCAYGSV